MDKPLIIRILGKKDAVDLDDSLYSLRDIADQLRNVIILGLSIDDEFKTSNTRKLLEIDDIIQPISLKLKDFKQIQGYTNSRNYLSSYIDDISNYIHGIIQSFENDNFKDFTYYSNMLMDCILKY